MKGAVFNLSNLERKTIMESYESIAPKPMTSQFENRTTKEEAAEKCKRQKMMQIPLYPAGKNFVLLNASFFPKH